MTAFIAVYLLNISEAYSTCKSLGYEWGAHVILGLHHNVSNSAAGVLQ